MAHVRSLSLVVVGLVFLQSCGGGGRTPTAPAQTPEPPIALTITPSSGSHNFEFGPGMVIPTITPPITWTVRFRAPASISQQWVRLRLLQPDGRACWHSALQAGAVVTGSMYNVTQRDFSLPDNTFRQSVCGNDFSTSIADVQLTNGAPFPFLSNPDIQQGMEFQNAYQFHRVGDLGGPPQPTPAPPPSPGPTPTPGPAPSPVGFPACPGNPQNASCGVATGQCNDNSFTCSQNRQGTCSSHGGLKCVYCPGPICQG